MGCQKCRGWEDSICCLSLNEPCTCDCHLSCDCAFCHTVELKARSLPNTTTSAAHARSTALRITSALRLDSRSSLSYDGLQDSRPLAISRLSSDENKAEKARRWSLRNSSLKPLRMFA